MYPAYPVDFRYKPDGTFDSKFITFTIPYTTRIELDEFPEPNTQITVVVDGIDFVRTEVYPPQGNQFYFERVTCNVYLPDIPAANVTVSYYGIGTIIRAKAIKDLADKFDQLYDLIGVILGKDPSGEISRLEQKILELQERLLDAVNRLNELLHIIDNHEQRLDSLENKMSVIEPLLNTLQQSLTNILNRLSNVEEKLNNLEPRVNTLEIQVDAINSAINRLNQDILNIQQNINTLFDLLSGLRTDLEDLKQLIYSINDRLHVVEENYPYIGTPSDKTYTDGLIPWAPETRISEAFDAINTYLKKVDKALNSSLQFDRIEISEPNFEKSAQGFSLDTDIPVTIVPTKDMVFTCEVKGFLSFNTVEVLLDGDVLDTLKFQSFTDMTQRRETQYLTSIPMGYAEDYLPKTLITCKLDLEPGPHRFVIRVVEENEEKTSLNFFVVAEEVIDAQDIDLDIEVRSVNIQDSIYLSGVQYATKGTVELFVKANNIGRYTYINNNLILELPDDTVQEYTFGKVEGKIISFDIPKIIGVLGFTVKVSALHSTYGFSEVKKTRNFFVDLPVIGTEQPNSTYLEEFFFEETYRLPRTANSIPSISVWNSRNNLQPGEAIVLPGQLKGEGDYVRFFSQNQPYSNGVIEIKGSFEFGTTLKAWIKAEQTGWLSLNGYFDLKTFDGSDGQNALVLIESIEGGIRLHWTIGKFVTTRYMIKLQLERQDIVTYIAEVGWKS